MVSWSESSPQIQRAFAESARKSKARRTGNIAIDSAHEEIENNPIMRSPNAIVTPANLFEIPENLRKHLRRGGAILTAAAVLAPVGYVIGDRLGDVANPKIVTNEQVTTVPDYQHGPLASKTVTITTKTPDYGG